MRDNLTVGFNQNYLVATWVGNNNNSPMSKIASGVTGASPIWNEIMTGILTNKPSIDWDVPEGLMKINICSLTGTLPCEGCPTRQEWFTKESQPKNHCSPEVIKNILEGAEVKGTPSPQILETGASTENP